MYEKSKLDEKLIEKGEENSFNEKLDLRGKSVYQNENKLNIKQKKYRSNLVVSVINIIFLFYTEFFLKY